MLFGNRAPSALVSERYALLCLQVSVRVCLCVSVRACMFIIPLIVYGSCFLWRNKLKLLNLFAAVNAISQGYAEWLKDARGASDLSDETAALWVTVGSGSCSAWAETCDGNTARFAETET